MTVRFWGVIGSVASPRGLKDVRAKILEVFKSYESAIRRELFEGFKQALPITSQAQLKEVTAKSLNRLSKRLPLFLDSLPIGVAGTYGGNTSCVEVRTVAGERVILDAGTGIRQCGVRMMNEGFGCGQGRALILLSHTHFDHIVGWPFFVPAYIQGNRFDIWGPMHSLLGKGLSEVFSGIMDYSFFPVYLNEMGGTLNFRDIGKGAYRYGQLEIEASPMHHPCLTLGFRLTLGGKVVVFQTDTEHYTASEDDPNSEFGELLYNQGAVELARDADIFICDAQYTPEEYEPERFSLNGQSKKSWGHCTYEHAVKRAHDAGAKKLVLYHHDPQHNDQFIDEMCERARGYAREIGYQGEILSAYEGLEIKV